MFCFKSSFDLWLNSIQFYCNMIINNIHTVNIFYETNIRGSRIFLCSAKKQENKKRVSFLLRTIQFQIIFSIIICVSFIEYIYSLLYILHILLRSFISFPFTEYFFALLGKWRIKRQVSFLLRTVQSQIIFSIIICVSFIGYISQKQHISCN